jgi:hypothetical protein
MELRHLRSSQAVGEALNFTKGGDASADRATGAEPAGARLGGRDRRGSVEVECMRSWLHGRRKTLPGGSSRIVEPCRRGGPSVRAEEIHDAGVGGHPTAGWSARRDYSGFNRILRRMFAPTKCQPRIAVECDSSTSLLTGLETCRGVGIARAAKGNLKPAWEKSCPALRNSANGTKAGESNSTQ